ncbi:MAG: T9SS type A sorting domain-containing protein [Bacteroidota bacterium]|nr:T9SS type A sorting domain-containing protein [Bacteroidota bacterium]
MASRRELQRFEGHTNDINSVVFSPDGTRLASGTDDNTIRLWDVATGQELRRIDRHVERYRKPVNSVAFSPDGTHLASGSKGEVRNVCLWRVATGRGLGCAGEHSGSVNSVAFSPDGTRLASGSDDGTIRLREVALVNRSLSLKGHRKPVNSVVFSPDGTQLVSGSDDGTIRLWDVATRQETAQLDHGYPARSIAIPRNENFIASAGGIAIRLWDVTVTALEAIPLSSSEIQTAFTHYPNPAGAFTTIEYVLSEASQVRLTVHDLLGRKVVSVLDVAQAAGSHSLQLATGQLSGGMYFLRLITNDSRVTRPLIVP